MARGRPPIDKDKRERDQRRATLHKGMLACYEIIDMARNELAELDAAEASARGVTAVDGQSFRATGIDDGKEKP